MVIINTISRRAVAGALLLLAHGGALRAQAPLTLAAALQRADAHAYANRISGADADAASAQGTATLRGILPAVRLDAGLVRTTDPIGVFGTALRQRRITSADFDPQRLNYPAAVTNYAGAAIVEQPLFNADALLGRRVALRGAEAAHAMATWSVVNTRLDVVRAYFGAVLAAEKVGTLAAGHKAAQSHAQQAQRLVDAGLATRSDALLAQVKAGEIETQLVEAQGATALARRQLALTLGTPEDTAFTLPAALPTASLVRALLSNSLPSRPEARSDVVSARQGLAAASSNATRAISQYLPRLNAFARYDWNSETRVYAGPDAWSIGVMASWTPFAGAAQIADQADAAARKRAAAARLDAAKAQASFELEQAENARVVALKKLEIAERAVAQSAEAHRIISRKYEGGLATVSELLDAAAVETHSALSLSAARYNGIVVEVQRHRAAGSNLAEMPALLTRNIAENNQ
jgi:outer membrane protein TolC